jgi:hypothetical protein
MTTSLYNNTMGGSDSSTSRKQRTIRKRAEAVSKALAESSGGDTVQERISPAKPAYSVRDESISRATRTASPPAFTRNATNNKQSPPVNVLPPSFFSGEFDVPAVTPRPYRPPPVEEGGRQPRFRTSPNKQCVMSPVHFNNSPPLPPIKTEIPSLSQNLPPSVTVKEVEPMVPPSTTVKIDPVIPTSGWFRGRTEEHPSSTKPPIATASSPRHSSRNSRLTAPPPPPIANMRTTLAPRSPSYSNPPPPPYHSSSYAPPPSHYNPHRSRDSLSRSYENRPEEKRSNRPNYALLSDERLVEIRKQFYTKFLILQRNFPKWNIPLPADGSTIDYIHDLYESYVKQVTISQSATQFKIVLVMMFCGIEFAASKAGIDIQGYAESQIRTMNRYEGVLIELGEKYSGEGGGEWPIEARIMMIAVVQAGVFCLAKYIEKWTGATGISKTIHSTLDSMIDNMPIGNGNSGEQLYDSSGIPIAPGTEKEIASVDDDVNAAMSSDTFGSGRGNVPRAAPAPALDIGGLLGGLLAGGGGGGGAGGLDVASLVGGAMKFLNAAASPSNAPGPVPPPPSNHFNNTTKVSSPNLSPPLPKRSPPRSAPRKPPVFHSE